MKQCEICGGKAFALVATEIREGAGRISKCAGCGLVVQDVDWSEADVERYYNEVYQISNSLDAQREQTPREHFESRLKTVRPLAERIRPLVKPGMKILDVGCGAGELLHALKAFGAEVTGVEICKAFVDFMSKDLGIRSYAQDVNKIDFGAEKFDLIISIDALDHLPNPLKTLRTMDRLLAPGGSLYLQVPNLDQALNVHLPEPSRKAFNTFFWHRAHFFYFSPETFPKLLAQAGFAGEITTCHEYTLRNFLNWYFKGSPQALFVDAATGVGLFPGASPFEAGMNAMFTEMDARFHALLKATGRGDTLCCVAKRRAGA